MGIFVDGIFWGPPAAARPQVAKNASSALIEQHANGVLMQVDKSPFICLHFLQCRPYAVSSCTFSFCSNDPGFSLQLVPWHVPTIAYYIHAHAIIILLLSYPIRRRNRGKAHAVKLHILRFSSPLWPWVIHHSIAWCTFLYLKWVQHLSTQYIE